jgi:predicted NBD/HSP70 family sugar kinase
MNQSDKPAQALVFDLGGTYLRCGLWNNSREISSLRRMRIENFLNGRGSSAIWNSLISQTEDYHRSVANLVTREAPIVVSFPGPIHNGRQILSAPTFLGEDTAIPDLVSELEGRTGRKVYILNDISAAAWYLSLSTTVDRFMVITISSGIGSKIFDRSHSAGVIDSPAWAGEIGHMVVDDSPDAPLCDCGGVGHLGAIASGRGVERAARRYACDDPGAFARSACVTKFGATPHSLNNEEHIVPSARSGDPWSLEVVRYTTKPLARVILSVVLGGGIERVTMIGGLALGLGSVYLQVLREELVAICRYSLLNERVASLVELGVGCEEACLKGAGVFAQRLLEIPG